MLLLGTSDDSRRLMKEWRGVVLSPSTPHKSNEYFFVREATHNDRVLHQMLCLVKTGAMTFREYESKEWGLDWDWGHFEVDHNGFNIKIGLCKMIHGSGLPLTLNSCRVYCRDQ